MVKTVVTVLLFVSFAAALQPNFMRSTVYKVGKISGVETDLQQTSYFDGLSRAIESKVKIDDTKDRTVCLFVDDAGRPDTTSLPFIDRASPGAFLKTTLKDLLDNTIPGPLWRDYNDAYAFSYQKYSDDPLSRVIERNGPGIDFIAYPSRVWYFGVNRATYPITVGATTFTITDGFITAPPLTKDLLNLLSTSVPANPDHFLTVTQSPGSAGAFVYNQELKTVFGTTVSTMSKASAADLIISRFEFDILNNLLCEKAPSSATAEIDSTIYEYNSLNQLIRKVTPDGAAYGYAFDEAGRMACDTSIASGGAGINRIRRYLYDNIGRQISTEVLEGATFVPLILNFYDNTDGLTGAAAARYRIPEYELKALENLTGGLVASVAANRIGGRTYYVTDLYNYDDENRVRENVKIVPGMPLQRTVFTYDLHGKILSATMTCGNDVVSREFRYDAEGRLDTVVHGNNADKPIASYLFDSLSRLQSKNLSIGGAPGQDITFGYNIRQWVTSITPPAGVDGFTESISLFGPNGNIINASYAYKAVATSATYNLSYIYDDASRLKEVTSAAAAYQSKIDYDPIGRITEKKEGADNKTGYEYFSRTNRLKKINGMADPAYMYDKEGNLVFDVSKKLVIEYDPLGMPVAWLFYNFAAVPGTITADARGTCNVTDLRAKMAVAAGVTLLSEVIALYDASGSRVYKREVRK